jgi:hypothetical protein
MTVTPEMPPAIFSVAASRTCDSLQSFTTHTPYLRVRDVVSGNAMRLHIALLSTEGTSAEADRFHAFVSVDGQPIVLTLAPQATIVLTYPGLAAGVHSVRYGVYYRTNLLQDESFCRTIAP